MCKITLDVGVWHLLWYRMQSVPPDRPVPAQRYTDQHRMQSFSNSRSQGALYNHLSGETVALPAGKHTQENKYTKADLLIKAYLSLIHKVSMTTNGMWSLCLL